MQFSDSLFAIIFALSNLCFSLASSGSLTTSGSASESSPNPIKNRYPNSVTGTINSTIALVPIPYGLARSIVPSQYPILKKAYQALLPGFPDDKYPLVVRAGFDHDINSGIALLTIDDFQKIAIQYPFIDLLNDTYSSFAYQNHLILTSTNLLASLGAAMYGTLVDSATFSPELQAYADSTPGDGSIYLNANSANVSSNGTLLASTKFKVSEASGRIGPWSLEFYKNVTNQPIFTSGLICDNQINLFNTTLSTGSNKPVGIHGEITLKTPVFPQNSVFKNVFGVKVDIAFLENNAIECSTLKGYSGTGSGD